MPLPSECLLRMLRMEISTLTLTFLPNSLLCKLTTFRASSSCSRSSMKRLVTFSPNQMLSLQPPHCQSPLPLFGCLFFNSTHRHPGILFSLHCCVISCVIAAVLMACKSAVSRVAAMIEEFIFSLTEMSLGRGTRDNGEFKVEMTSLALKIHDYDTIPTAQDLFQGILGFTKTKQTLIFWEIFWGSIRVLKGPFLFKFKFGRKRRKRTETTYRC